MLPSDLQKALEETTEVFSVGRDALINSQPEIESEDPELANFTYAQLHILGKRAQAVNWLLQGKMWWDAEIIMRSAMESTVKILFVCFCEPDEREQRIEEFWHDMGKIHRLRQSERARTLLGQLSTNSSVTDEMETGLKPVVLSREEERELAEKWSEKRSSLEQKWSIPNMLSAIQNHMVREEELAVMESMLHNYGIASHLIHGDESALTLHKDRSTRPSDERERLEKAHVSRLLSDQLAYVRAIMSGLSYATDIDGGRWEEFDADRDELDDRFESLQKLFFSMNI